MIIAFQTRILERFMSKEELAEFFARYREALLIYRRDSQHIATDQDMMILLDHQNGMLVSELCQKYNKPSRQIENALRIAAVSQLHE